jgi:hypothetical protein
MIILAMRVRKASDVRQMLPNGAAVVSSQVDSPGEVFACRDDGCDDSRCCRFVKQLNRHMQFNQ